MFCVFMMITFLLIFAASKNTKEWEKGLLLEGQETTGILEGFEPSGADGAQEIALIPRANPR